MSTYSSVMEFLREDAAPIGRKESYGTDEFRFRVSDDGETLHLEDLAVRPDARGQNHGKEVMDALTDFADDAGYMRIVATIRLTDTYSRWELPTLDEIDSDPTVKLLSPFGFSQFDVRRSKNEPRTYAVRCVR